jgi:hypothetical protein
MQSGVIVPPGLAAVVFQDHAFADISTGTVTVLYMNQLDPLKVRFQGRHAGPRAMPRGIWRALCNIDISEAGASRIMVWVRVSWGTRAAADSTVSCVFPPLSYAALPVS